MATAPAYTNATGDGLGKQALAYAARFLGVPYVYGGESPQGFDCSGLVQYAYDKLGIKLPRTSQEQAKVGLAVPRDELQPGDLLFFNEPGEGANSHVAIYAGGGQEIEAPHPGATVRIAAVDWAHFSGARRVAGAVTGIPGTGTSQASDPTVSTASPADWLTAGVKSLVLQVPFVLAGVALLVWGVSRMAGGQR